MLLPADTYTIYNKGNITENDIKILIDLYQPIIGNKAVSLYLTLLNDLDKKEIISSSYNHHHLLSVMQISLEEILSSREKLEAVGLLKTYFKKGDINNYIYILYSPISANEFLNHPILNIVLYNNIGKTEYQNIVENYKVPRISVKDYEDISSAFDQVFSSVATSSYFQNEDLISKDKARISFKDEIDFELLLSGVNKQIINEKTFTKDVRNLINNLCFIYNIDIVSMQNLIMSNITEKSTIDKDALRKSARNFYQFEHNGNLPTLIYSKQPEHLKTPTGGTSNKAKMIYTFENTNPYQFIKSKYKDGKVITRDLQIIENLLIDLKLTPGVVNVLIDYVLKTNNQKLNKTYIETIASHWKRLGIETVEEAMDACIKEYKKHTKTKESTKKQTKLPDWFCENIEKKEVKKEEEKELQEMLKKYS